MKKMFIAAAVALLSTAAFADNLQLSEADLPAANKEIIKTGLNFGPLPAIAFDADKGFQYGAILNIYSFGDGSTYPNPKSTTYLETSFFTKGSKLIQAEYDSKYLVPGVRVSGSLSINLDGAFDFFGYNGYESYYTKNPTEYFLVKDQLDDKTAQKKYSPYYKMKRNYILAKVDFTGQIGDSDLYWEAGYDFQYYNNGAIDREIINKGKESDMMFPDAMPTLYESYCKWGLIPEELHNGGISSSVRLGMMYDTRDVEAAPTRGIWAEAHISAAPKFIGNTMGYARYNVTWRHYLPLIENKLTFAYRLNYLGTFGNQLPYYQGATFTRVGKQKDMDSWGGYGTVRGIYRTRITGLDVAMYNFELRWIPVAFPLFNQNIALGLSAFHDGASVIRGYDMSFKGNVADPDYVLQKALYESYMKQAEDAPGSLHSIHGTYGAGFRFIMNKNFIIAVEKGWTINKQDGDGGFYINLGYLF